MQSFWIAYMLLRGDGFYDEQVLNLVVEKAKRNRVEWERAVTDLETKHLNSEEIMWLERCVICSLLSVSSMLFALYLFYLCTLFSAPAHAASQIWAPRTVSRRLQHLRTDKWNATEST